MLVNATAVAGGAIGRTVRREMTGTVKKSIVAARAAAVEDGVEWVIEDGLPMKMSPKARIPAVSMCKMTGPQRRARCLHNYLKGCVDDTRTTTTTPTKAQHTSTMSTVDMASKEQRPSMSMPWAVVPHRSFVV